MTIGRVTMLTNPASGHGSAPHAAERAVTQLHKRGVDVVAIAGTDAEHARRLVEGALERGMDALVVVGGDGIISLALQVLAQTDIPWASSRRAPATTTRVNSVFRQRIPRRRPTSSSTASWRPSTWAASRASTAPTSGSAQ